MWHLNCKKKKKSPIFLNLKKNLPSLQEVKREIINTIQHILRFTLKNKSKTQSPSEIKVGEDGQTSDARCPRELRWTNPVPEISSHHQGHSKEDKLITCPMEKGREVEPTIKDKVQQELNHTCKIKQKESTINTLCSHPVIKLLTCTFQKLFYFFNLTVKRTDENCYIFLLPNWLISIFISTNSLTQPLEATKLNLWHFSTHWAY